MGRKGLAGTDVEDRTLDLIKIECDGHDLLHAWTEDGEFEAACGPLNLGEAIHDFRSWVLGLS